jgi:hypothetical protein
MKVVMTEDLEQTVTTRLEMNDDAHGFPVAGEGDHLYDSSRHASFLPILPTENRRREALVLDPTKASCLISRSISSKAVELIVMDRLNEAEEKGLC